VLIGEPGVGKTPSVEDCTTDRERRRTESLRRRELVALDIGQLLAGAKYRGEFESLKAFVKELTRVKGSFIHLHRRAAHMWGRRAEGGRRLQHGEAALARGELH